MSEERYAQGRAVLAVGTAGNVLLAAAKVAGGLLGGSAALLADGVHATIDVGAILASWIGFFVSHRPADREHPYGHQKAESIAQKIVAILLILAGFEVLSAAVRDLLRPELLPPSPLALWAAVTTTAVKFPLSRITGRRAEELRSSALAAAARDHEADLGTGLAAVAGVALSRLGFRPADPLAALLVSGLVLTTGVRLVVQAVDSLMDRFGDEAFLAAVRRTVADVPGVEGVAGLRGRPLGDEVLLDVEILVRGDLTVREGHAVARAVRHALEARHPRVRGVHVHVNPYPDETAGATPGRHESRDG